MYYVVTRENPPCPYCKMAKNYLKNNNLEFVEVPLEEGLPALQRAGVKTVPAIFTEEALTLESYLGGYDYLKTIKPLT
jgi:glutaredoxin